MKTEDNTPSPAASETNKVIVGRILDAVYKSLQWQDGEIAGIEMDKLEQKINGILGIPFVESQTVETQTEIESQSLFSLWASIGP